MLTLIRLLFIRRTALIGENLFLRKQLSLFKERRAEHRRTTAYFRVSIVALSRLFNWRDALMVVRPETFIKWHREAFRAIWRFKSRKIGRPALPKELQQLIRRRGRENPTWGEDRIADELNLKLGISISPATVRKYLKINGPSRGSKDQRWSTFVRNHANGIVACDFLISVTATFQVLYLFVAMEVGSRRILHTNVTKHPTAEWATQQFREFLVFDHAYRFVIHDRDCIFSVGLDLALKGFGVRPIRTPVRIPNGECLLRTAYRNYSPGMSGLPDTAERASSSRHG